MPKPAWKKVQEMEKAGTLPKPPATSPRRHDTLTRWYAVGFHDQPGWPIPKHNKRHIDRWCGYLADKPDEDIRELSEEEIAEHERCLGCAG